MWMEAKNHEPHAVRAVRYVARSFETIKWSYAVIQIATESSEHALGACVRRNTPGVVFGAHASAKISLTLRTSALGIS